MSRLIPISNINGISMSDKLQPAKDGYKITKSDLYSDSTARSAETGVLMSYIIRRNVYSIELNYIGTAAEINEIDNIIAPATSRKYNVTFLDYSATASDNNYVTKLMYPSDRQKSTSVIVNGVQYMQLSVTLVEV